MKKTKKGLIVLLSALVLFTLTLTVAPAMAADLWQSDSAIVSGLGYIGTGSKPTVFNMDGTWYLISGEVYGAFYGFKWTGSTWESNRKIVSKLGDVGDKSAPTVFNMDGTWYLISGERYGEFYGFHWTGAQWVSDPAIISGLGDVGYYSAPTVFNKDGTWYLISGASDEFYGYNWTGAAWQSDPAIVSELIFVGDTAATPTVFNKDGTWYLISGEWFGGRFYGYKWTGSEWQSDPWIVSGLGSVGYSSKPTVFYMGETWYLISGESYGTFYGWHQVKKPELTPTAITAPPLFVNQPSTVNATIANIGVVDASSFNVSLSASGSVVDTVNVPSLSAGNTTNVSFAWTPTSGGEQVLCVVADSDNVIDEIDETNNETCIFVTIIAIIEVDKTVWDPVSETWVKEVTANVGDTLRFKCVINNTASYNLTNISVSDILSGSLNYSNNATVDGVPMEPDQVSPNEYEWSFTTLEPSQTITIEFNASAVMPGTDTNVQSVSAWCEQTGEWVSAVDSVRVRVIEIMELCWTDTFDDETKIAEKQEVLVHDGDAAIDLENPPWIWGSNSSLVSGLGLVEEWAWSKPAIAFNITGDGRWNLIAGTTSYGFYGFYWDDSAEQWVSDPSLVTGLGVSGVGLFAPAIAFNVTGDGKWNLITGYNKGGFAGFYWNGSQWVSDSSLVDGLGVICCQTTPAIAFNITGAERWNLIAGTSGSGFHGFYWNTSVKQWISNPSLVTGLITSNERAPAIAFNITGAGNWNLISGTTSGCSGFYWDGSAEQWISDPSLVSGVSITGTPDYPYIFYTPAIAFNITGAGRWNLISGSKYGYFHGFEWIEGAPGPGSIKSVLIQPFAFNNWVVFNANDTVLPGTNITYKILDASNNTIMSVVDGQNISSISQTSIRLYAELTTDDVSKTPVLHDWSVCWETSPHPSIDVDKTVWDPASETWLKETTAVSDTLRFRSVITNTGLFNLTNITVSDILSDCLSYNSGSATVDGEPMEPEQVGSNEYEWNFTSLEPFQTITIEFDVSAVMPGTGINVQNATAWCELTGEWTSDEDSVSVTVPLLVWQYGAGMPWDVERLSDGNTLITEHGNHTVIEVTPAGEIAWIYGNGTSGSGPGQLGCPIDAERLTNGSTLITDRMNERVIEVNSTGAIVWQYGTTGASGNGANQLYQPRDAERLENGNTLITDRLNNRVIEVRTADYDPAETNNGFTADSIVWQVTGLNHPADAEPLPNGNMLIVVYKDHTVIEINTATKKIVWQYGTTGTEGSGINQLNYPEAAERLPNNNTLIADRMNNRIIEVTPANIIIRQYGTGVKGSGENELDSPADAERLSSGSTLIADTGSNRVITVITMPPPAPMVLSFAPPSPVYDLVGAVRTFSITIDQVVDVEWQKNGVLVQSNASVTESSYMSTAQEGTWTVTAIASNANGTDMQQWDWIGVSEMGPDLIVSEINAYHNNTDCPAWFNLSNEVDVTVTNIGTEPVGETSVSLHIDDVLFGKLPVPGLAAGASATVTFENWIPVGEDCLLPVCEFDWSFKDYNFTAMADCDNNVRKESDETNNEAMVVDRACYNGYMADEPLENVAHGMLHGGLLFTTGDGVYSSLYSVGDTQVTNYDITIPDGAAVNLAHLNVYYTWTKPDGVCPEMEVSITTPDGTTYTLPLMKAYNDLKCTCPGAAWVLTWGNYVYNVTDYIDVSGTYTVTVKNVCTLCTQFCPAAPGLTILYEDKNAPLIEYWINNGADILMGGRRYPTSSNLAWWENINNATFPASTDTLRVANATLGTVSVWGGAAWTEGATNYLFFNDVELGSGVYHGYSEIYEETIDSISMYVGSTNAQVGVNVTDITALYLKGSDNVVGQADNGDNMVPANAFLVVEYGEEAPPKPDLTVTEKYETLLEDGNFTVTYTVANIGDDNAGASSTIIYVNGSNVLEDPVPALAAGANCTNTVGPFDCPCGATLNVTVCADNDNVIAESKETNNCKVNFVECPEALTNVATYDFANLTSAGVDKWAYRYQIEPKTPTTNGVPDIKFTEDEYTMISENDHKMQKDSTNVTTFYAAHRFVFNINESVDSIVEIEIQWIGKGVTRDKGQEHGATLYIWNATSSQYEELGNTPSRGRETLTGVITANPENYIDTDGILTILVVQNAYQSAPKGRALVSMLSTDYIRADVTYYS